MLKSIGVAGLLLFAAAPYLRNAANPATLPANGLVLGGTLAGWGREMGSQVLNNYLETKSVVTAL